jgi:peptidyl-prolyl cis-trans isomerase C
MRRLALLLLLAAAPACQEKAKEKASDRSSPRDETAPKTPEERKAEFEDSVRVAGQSASDVSAPLAKVGDVTITVGEFQDQLGRQSPHIRNKFTSLEQKREFLENMIRFEVLAAEAAKRGLDQDPEVVRTMKSVMVQKLMREEFEAKIPADSIPESELKAYYEANLAEYVKPEEVRASAIVVKNGTQAKKIAAEAQGDAGKTNKGFRDLVQKYSTDDATKVRGGDLRYFSRTTDGIPQAVKDAAFDLKQTGKVSGAIDAGDGTWWVLKQTGHKKAMTKTFEDVKQAIRSKLHREKRLAAQEQFYADLKAAAKIEVMDDNLAKVKIDAAKRLEAADPHDHSAPQTEQPSAPPAEQP